MKPRPTKNSIRKVDAKQSTGHGHSHVDVGHTGSNFPLPVHSRYPVSVTKSERHLRGEHNPLNQSGASALGAGKSAPTSRGAIPPGGRQMPHPDLVTKAAEVAANGGAGLGTKPDENLLR